MVASQGAKRTEILHESFLRHENYRYAKWSLALVVIATTVFVLDEPVGGRNGGTWVGYTLGFISAGLVLWLAYYGIRKRRYYSKRGSAKGWLSAHFYLGLTLPLLVLLHSGGQLGWNVHTLAFVLLVLVIASGVVGVAVYRSAPVQISAVRAGETPGALLERIAEVDRECTSLAEQLPDAIARSVATMQKSTQLGGGLYRRLRGADPGRATQSAELAIQEYAKLADEQAGPTLMSLSAALGRRYALLRRLTRDLRLRAWLDSWLLLHVPLTVATIAAIVTHVIVVFYYR